MYVSIVVSVTNMVEPEVLLNELGIEGDGRDKVIVVDNLEVEVDTGFEVKGAEVVGATGLDGS